MARVRGEDGAEPLAVGAEDVLAAVERVQLPAAGRGVEVQLAEFVRGNAGGGEIRELAEAAVPGEQPDVAGVRIDDDPLREIVYPIATQDGAPGGGTGVAVAADGGRRRWRAGLPMVDIRRVG